MNIWALTDSRIGNTKQTLALADALGKFSEKKVEFTKLAKLPNKLLGNSLIGVKANFSGKKPDLIISAGRKLARVAANLKKEYGCKAIHIMYPSDSLAKKFDYIITPNHDEVKPAQNIIKITGSICAIKKTTSKKSEGIKQVAVLVGNITAAEAKKMAELLNQHPALYSITTSRRTNSDAIKTLDSHIRQTHQIYKFGSKLPNPYNSYLENADIIIVSGDSANMLTEAAHTGKPVYILEVETKEKFQKLWQELYSLKIARKLDNKLEKWQPTPLNNLEIITQTLKI